MSPAEGPAVFYRQDKQSKCMSWWTSWESSPWTLGILNTWKTYIECIQWFNIKISIKSFHHNERDYNKTTKNKQTTTTNKNWKLLPGYSTTVTEVCIYTRKCSRRFFLEKGNRIQTDCSIFQLMKKLLVAYLTNTMAFFFSFISVCCFCLLLR